MNNSITYVLGENLYINLTNRCPCACEFCLRTESDTVGDSASLWLTREPTAAEVVAELSARDLTRYPEIVFCGYGEPTCALETLLEVATWLKQRGAVTRLNTNGLSDLIHSRPTAELFCGKIDTISISLNASTAERYAELCKPAFGVQSFDSMLSFAKDCKQCVPSVVFTLVDVLPPTEIAACQAIADAAGIPLRIRSFQ